MGALQSFISLPAFILSVFVFYWSLPLGAIIYRIPFLQMKGRRRDTYNWWVFAAAQNWVSRRLTVFASKLNSQCHVLVVPCRSKMLAGYFGATVKKQGTEQLYKKGLVVYLVSALPSTLLAFREFDVCTAMYAGYLGRLWLGAHNATTTSFWHAPGARMHCIVFVCIYMCP